MAIIEISSESEGEVTSEFRCSKPSCIPGHCVYSLLVSGPLIRQDQNGPRKWPKIIFQGMRGVTLL